jgi:hypothetical protein
MAQIQIYTVRNSTGQKLGAFQATNPKQAIIRCITETAQTVRRHQPMPKGMTPSELTAKVEPTIVWSNT